MYVFVMRRILFYIPVLIGVSMAVFGLARLVPGDVVDIILSHVQMPEQAARLRSLFGLDKALHEQYFDWLGHTLRGDLGTSLFSGRPVLTEIWTALGPTMELAFTALLISVLVGIPLGVLAAVKRGSALDYASGFVAYLGISTPVFWSGTILILFFSIWLNVLPSGGYESLWSSPVQGFRLLIMPALALGLNFAALLMRVTRSSFLEVLRQEYISTARAKGLSERVVLFKHAMRNAMITIMTVAGVQLGFLIGGSAIVEIVFMRPGIGRLLLTAVLRRDYPLIQGLTLFIAITFMTVNLIVDVMYAVADPRIRMKI